MRTLSIRWIAMRDLLRLVRPRWPYQPLRRSRQAVLDILQGSKRTDHVDLRITAPVLRLLSRVANRGMELVTGVTGNVNGSVVAEVAPGRGEQVRAYDRDPIWDDRLGNADTDAQGGFRISFTASDFQEPLEGQPEIYLVVYDSPLSGRPLTRTRPTPGRRSTREKCPDTLGRVDFEIEIDIPPDQLRIRRCRRRRCCRARSSPSKAADSGTATTRSRPRGWA